MNLVLSNTELNEAVNLYLASRFRDIHTYDISTDIVVGRATPGSPKTGARAEVTMPRKEEFKHLDNAILDMGQPLSSVVDTLENNSGVILTEDTSPFDTESDVSMQIVKKEDIAEDLPTANMVGSLFNRTK